MTNFSHALSNAIKWIDTQQDYLIKTLINWSETNSGSTNLTGINLQAKKIIELFETKLNVKPQILNPKNTPNISAENNFAISQDINTGPIIVFEKINNKNKPIILLTGHYDTVFTKEHHFQKTKKISNNKNNKNNNNDILQGPGVADMKGGLLVILTAVIAFEKTEMANNLNWKIILNPDEEIGSPTSSIYLAQEGEKAKKTNGVGLVYEPSTTPDGTLASSRQSSGHFKLEAFRQSSHAGRDLFRGKNAIIALSRVIIKLHELSKKDNSLLIHIAKFNSDAPLNQVPDYASCKLNIRSKDKKNQTYFEDKLKEIIDDISKITKCKIIKTGKTTRPPKPLTPNQLKLFEFIKLCAKTINLDINWQPAGGVCDGNNLAECGLPVVDTLGVRGGLIHTDQEFIHLNSLTERSKLSAVILYNLAKQGGLK